MRTRPFILVMLSTFLAFPPLAATAGGSKDVGDYLIHYNALPTDQLAPAIASAYGVVRSRNRALLNIAVTRKEEGTSGVPVDARVNVNAANLSGQVKNVRIRRITEEGESKAIYYIAEINVADGETLIFDVKVTPEDRRQTHTVQFKQQFFVN